MSALTPGFFWGGVNDNGGQPKLSAALCNQN
ncbi:hypothetical protein SAMN05428959_102712 [Duganella sp. CF517]|nr:hypothetical protein SAMN05428959_102712 [Duganella sp. CF517]